MKKLKYIYIMILLSLLPTQVKATDYLFLEYLITNHKTVSDLLLARVGVDAASVVEYDKVSDTTEEFKSVRETLNGRYGFKLLDMVGMGLQAVQIVDQAAEVIDLTGRAVDAAVDVCDKFPEILDIAIYMQQRNGDKIIDIYRIVAQVVSAGVGVALATNEQKFLFLDNIRSNLRWMEENNRRLYCLAKSFEGYEVPREVNLTLKFREIEQKAFENAEKRIDEIFKALE